MVDAAMSVNCPHCHSLVAVDAVTGAVPEYCPYCDGAIAVEAQQPDAEDDDNRVIDDDHSHSQDGTSAFDGAHEAAAVTALPADQPDPAADTGSEADVPGAGDTTAPMPKPAQAGQKRGKNARPSFAGPRLATPAPARRARWPLPLAASLLVTLLLQLIVADRASLAAQPRWRAAIAAACDVLRCDIPPWREAGAFTMLARDVQAHPGAVDALRVRAAFRNDARWPQPWPQLLVTLSDASGRVTGSRTFVADEYLGGVPTQKLIATGQTAAIALEIVEPAPDTVSFSFDFR